MERWGLAAGCGDCGLWKDLSEWAEEIAVGRRSIQRL